jgi:hypothetical protein
MGTARQHARRRELLSRPGRILDLPGTKAAGPNRRARRIAIVAVARRLVIALWRYLKDGVIPEGAELEMR